MLDHGAFINIPQIQDLLTILQQRSRTQDNRRSQTRETSVCPVSIQLQYDLGRLQGFTKDISSSGVCLISESEFALDTIATLSIYQSSDVPIRLRARCVWQQSFGQGYQQSGWKFLRRVFQNGK